MTLSPCYRRPVSITLPPGFTLEMASIRHTAPAEKKHKTQTDQFEADVDRVETQRDTSCS